MKSISTILFAVLIAANSFAQAPQKMTYQAVVRNATNALIQNDTIAIKVTIRQGSASGTIVYSETHSTQSNDNGLVNIEIGGGTVVSGTFLNGIFWAGGPYFLQTEIDPLGGTNYTINSTSELLSVPYSNYAHVSGYADSSRTASSQTQSGIDTGTASWDSIIIPHNRNQRPKKVTVKYVTNCNQNGSFICYVTCESEWFDDDRDGLGNLYYQVPFPVGGSSFTTEAINILSNTNMLGRLCLGTNQPGITLLMQEVTISSTLNNITILLAQPVPATYFSSTFIIVGPWRVLYTIEW